MVIFNYTIYIWKWKCEWIFYCLTVPFRTTALFMFCSALSRLRPFHVEHCFLRLVLSLSFISLRPPHSVPSRCNSILFCFEPFHCHMNLNTVSTCTVLYVRQFRDCVPYFLRFIKHLFPIYVSFSQTRHVPSFSPFRSIPSHVLFCSVSFNSHRFCLPAPHIETIFSFVRFPCFLRSIGVRFAPSSFFTVVYRFGF